jgi:hypothetical protein
MTSYNHIWNDLPNIQLNISGDYIFTILFCFEPSVSQQLILVKLKITLLWYGNIDLLLPVLPFCVLENMSKNVKSNNVTVHDHNNINTPMTEGFLLPYLLTPWSRVLLEKLTVNFAASQEIPRIYGTRISLPPDCFVSRGSISTWVFLNIRFLRRGVVSTSPNPQAGGPPLVSCPRLLMIEKWCTVRRFLTDLNKLWM